MSDRVFQDAYARVRSRHTDQAWFAMSPREITESIYREIRAIDGERLTGDTPTNPTSPIAAE